MPEFDSAARCLQRAGYSSAELEILVRRIRAVFAAHDWRVDPDALPMDPKYVDPRTHLHVFAPHPETDGMLLSRGADGRWLWTSTTLEEINRLYAESAGPWAGVVDALPPVFRGQVFGVQLWQYLALLGLLFLALIVRKIIAFIVATRVRALTLRLGQGWAARVVDVFASPGATLVTAGLLRITYPQLRLPIAAASAVSVLVRVLVVTSLVWALYRMVDVLVVVLSRRAAVTESKLDDQLVPLVRKAMKVFVVIAGALFILQNLDVDVGSLLAGLGLGGLAFALAAKDTLANLFGSVMIFLDRPFQIGDWIRIGETEGVIEEVGFRSTRIRTFYNSVVTVPNANFTESQIDNLGRREFRRCTVTLNLTYDTTAEQMQAFVEGVRAIISHNPHTRKDYYEVHMAGFGAYSLDVMVYFFFKVDSWTEELTQRHHVFLEILRLAHELGVVFAFPTQTLHVDALQAMGKPRDVPEPLGKDRLAEVVTAFGPGGGLARPEGAPITQGYLARKPSRRGASGDDGS